MGNSVTKIVVQNGPVNYHEHAFRDAADHAKGVGPMLLSIDQIRIGKRRRQARPEWVAEIAESIGKIGLLMPISVTSSAVRRANGTNDVAFDLVAGLHRLEACKSIGLTEIEVSVVQLNEAERELWEIDENLCRIELTELERGEHLMRRKESYEMRWPQTRQHVAGAAAANEAMGNATDNLAVASFAADVAEKVGLTERSIRRSIARAKKIEPKVRDRVRALPAVADSGTELDALAKLKPDQQKRAVALVESGQAHGIRAARKLMRPVANPASLRAANDAARQRRRDEFVRMWKALDDDDRRWARGLLAEPN